MTKSDHVRVDCIIIKVVDCLVKKHPLFGSRRKFIELAILEKIAKVKKNE